MPCRRPSIPLPLRLGVALLLLLGTPLVGRAEGSADGGGLEDGGSALDGGATLEPPTLLADSPARWPTGATATDGSPLPGGEVQLAVTLDAEGEVQRVEVVQAPDPALAEAALHAASGLRFSPARVGGQGVPVRFGYRYLFTPPLPEVLAADGGAPVRVSRLVGTLRFRGRNDPVPHAALAAHRRGAPEDELIGGESDGAGHFALDLAEGEWRIEVKAAGLDPFQRIEHLRADQQVEVVYFVSGPRSPYETVVVGARERTEVSRIDLSAEELRGVPGTFGGDPFRAVLALPGVSEVVSGVGFPVVRGASPASTGWFLDGVKLPNLFHFFLLSAVVHPRFIEGLEFYPSAAPAPFGRYTGGIAQVRTADGRSERIHGEVAVDLVNSAGFVESPLTLGDETLQLAAGGRVSYLGLGLKVVDALKLFEESGYGNYWDYQGRVQWSPAASGGKQQLRLLVFGSHDEVGATDQGKRERVLSITFHRVDLRWRGRFGALELEAAATVGQDAIGVGPTADIETRELMPRFAAHWRQGPLALAAGVDGEWKRLRTSITNDDAEVNGDPLFSKPVLGLVGGAWVEAQLKLGPVLLVPGLRGDHWQTNDATWNVLEPRAAVRWSLDETKTLKLGGGLYHQPPTLFLDVPFVDLLALNRGLSQALHAVVGWEQRIDSVGLDVEASLYWSEKLRLRELELSDPDGADTLPASCRIPETDLDGNPLPPSGDCQPDALRLRRGRSVGLELLVRRKLGEKLFGWVGYTLSRTTRWTPGLPTYLESFDQTHNFTAVASYELPARWKVGLGLRFRTGRPYDPATLETFPQGGGVADVAPDRILGCSDVRTSDDGTRCWISEPRRSARLPWFFRVDARVEKSWASDWFTLTAYLDVLNASIQSEVISRSYGFDVNGNPLIDDTSIPVVLPMLGVKAAF